MISFVLCRDTQICFNFLRYNRISRSILAWYRNLTVFMQIYLLNIGEILKWSVKKLIHKHMEYLCIHLYILITQKMETFRRGYSFLTLSFILYSYYLQSLQILSPRDEYSDDELTFGEWDDWLACSKSCGVGETTRTRTCTALGNGVCPAAGTCDQLSTCLYEEKTCQIQKCITCANQYWMRGCDLVRRSNNGY